MNKIDKKSSVEDLLQYADQIIKKRGDLIFIKIDGEREKNHVTVSISYPSDLSRQAIRYDDDDVRTALYEAIIDYNTQNEL